ncbi:MAG: HPr family phosphocarrier protein [Gammaproteobacteria bacterium]
MEEIERELTIINKLGLHARAAAKLVTVASGFESDIQLVRDSRRANAKSIMGVMMLAANKGTRLKLLVSGKDAEKAAQAITELFNDRFGEDE